MVQRIVGLDIGTSALRAVELVVDHGTRPVIEAFGQVGLPPGAVVGGEIRDPSQVTAALRRLWREGGFKETKVHVGVAGLRAITREMELPPLPPDELNDAVRLQADDVVPFPIEQASISSSVIARTTDNDGMPLVRVLVAAAHRELIDGVVRAIEDAGLEPVEIDLDTAALSRAFSITPSSKETEAIVSVGAGLTMVVVHRAGALQFVRTIDIGGDTVTRSISSALDLPMIDAEQLKRTLGRPGLSPQDEEIAKEAVAPVVSELVSEIHNSIRYYSSLPGREPPSRVLMTGGGARTTGLVEQLRRGLDIPVEEATPLAFVDTTRLPLSQTEAFSINPTVAVPIGLALDGAARTHFDLLPKEVVQKRTERQVQRLAVLLGILLVVLLGVLSLWKVLAVRTAEHNVSSLHAQATHLERTVIPKYNTAVTLANKVTTAEHQLAPLVSHEVDWLVVLNQLGTYLPTDAVISGLQLKPQTTASPSSSGGGASPATVIATATTSVAVGNLTEVTQFGLAMAQSPVLNVSLAGGVSVSTNSAQFAVQIQVLKAAHGQRTKLFEVPVP
jgi:type IV pilus assembly protein PilM